MFFKLNKKLSKASLSADNSLKRIVGPTVHNVLSSNRLFILRLFSALLYYVIGVSYYCSEEKWDILDAIFFITVSVSTVGYGDLHPTTDNSRLFTAFFILFGLVFVLTAVDDFARHVAIKFQNNVIDQYFSLDSRAERSTKKLVMSSASLLLLLVLGTLFFLCNEQWTSEEAFYWTVVTMTLIVVLSIQTVGYGDLTTKHQSTRGFTIVFIVLCLVTYATTIQNLREMYLLSLSIDLGDRDSGASHDQFVTSLNGATRGMSVRDADDAPNRTGSIEMSTPVSNGDTTSDGRGDNKRDTFNPLDGSGGTLGGVSLFSESESVDAVGCLLSLLEERSARSGDPALRKDLAALREKYNKKNGRTFMMSKKDIIHHVATYKDKTPVRAAVPVKEGGEGEDSSALISKEV